MTTALLAKELRELLPLWAVAMAGLGLMGLSDALTPLMLYFVPSAILGTLAPVALGAMSMGHEYRHGTLTSLLSLPVSRRRMLATKAVVLGALLIMLAGFAWWLGARTLWLLLPLALGFCLAPWFTVLTRSELAGTVFAGAIPALLLLAGDLVAEAVYGPYVEPRSAAYLLRSRTVGTGTAVLCAITMADTVRRFLSLQIIHGGHRASSSPSIARVRVAAVARRQTNVYLVLLKKELRLQVLPIVVGCAFGLSLWWGAWPYISSADGALRPLLSVLLAILCGAVASADERHLGVWASQALLPVPTWKQWMVKTAVVLGLAVTFGAVLGDLEASRWRFGYWTNVSISLPVFAVGAAALSLYVSSISGRGVVALLISVGAACFWMIAATILVGTLGRRTFRAGWQLFYDAISPAAVTNHTATTVTAVASGLALMLPIVVLVWIALRNHRRLDHPARIVRWQIAAIVVVSIVSLAGTAISAAFEDAVASRNIGSRTPLYTK